jgi:predicted aspartyl protease
MNLAVALGGGAEALAAHGIILNVAIGVDSFTAEALRAQAQPVPNPSSCQALLDTGASTLAIDRTIAQALRLSRRGTVTNHTANGIRQSNLYAVSLLFPSTSLRSYNLVRASEVDLSTQSFKCLIGRDILSNWHAHYNGQSGAVSIAD